MKNVHIEINGCDDTTYLDVIANDEQIKILEEVSRLSYENSSYTCQPTLTIFCDK